MNYLVVLCLFLCIGHVGARWAAACAESREGPAAFWNGFYYLIHTLSLLIVVYDPFCIGSMVLGGVIGTYVSVRAKRVKGVAQP